MTRTYGPHPVARCVGCGCALRPDKVRWESDGLCSIMPSCFSRMVVWARKTKTGDWPPYNTAGVAIAHPVVLDAWLQAGCP